MAKKKSFRSAPRMVSGRESDRWTRLMRLPFVMEIFSCSKEKQTQGNSHAMKFTAAMAMPTPKSTPASTRFEPPSPKAKVRPDTTIATSESPRAMVLVNAVWSTLTAFSHGEVPVWAKTGAATRSVRPMVTRGERSLQLRTHLRRNRFMFGFSPSVSVFRNGPLRGGSRILGQQEEGG